MKVRGFSSYLVYVLQYSIQTNIQQTSDYSSVNLSHINSIDSVCVALKQDIYNKN